nr:MAG TPA: hypothetical protein [Caudoviricetes sp.]
MREGRTDLGNASKTSSSCSFRPKLCLRYKRHIQKTHKA